LIKNSQPFGKKFKKTVGGIFWTHTVCYRVICRLTINVEALLTSSSRPLG